MVSTGGGGNGIVGIQWGQIVDTFQCSRYSGEKKVRRWSDVDECIGEI